MTNRKIRHKPATPQAPGSGYDAMLSGVAGLLEEARRTSARAVNAIMTATYWEIGRRIVEYEQGGKGRAQYGVQLLERLALDLGGRFGRGFSVINLRSMRKFYKCWPESRIRQTPSVEFMQPEDAVLRRIPQTASMKSSLSDLTVRFPLPWSHYVRLMSVKNPQARTFYEDEALRGGWTGPQLDRQISSLFYERTALSRNKPQC